MTNPVVDDNDVDAIVLYDDCLSRSPPSDYYPTLVQTNYDDDDGDDGDVIGDDASYAIDVSTPPHYHSRRHSSLDELLSS